MLCKVTHCAGHVSANIPGLISCAGVTGRWGLPYHACAHSNEMLHLARFYLINCRTPSIKAWYTCILILLYTMTQISGWNIQLHVCVLTLYVRSTPIENSALLIHTMQPGRFQRRKENLLYTHVYVYKKLVVDSTRQVVISCSCNLAQAVAHLLLSSLSRGW